MAPDPEDPSVPEFMAAPDPFEVIKGMTPEKLEESEQSPYMSAMGMPYGKPPMPILVTPDGGGPPIPMMVPMGGGPLVPYTLSGPGAPPPVPILVSGPGGAPKVMM